MVFCCSRCNWAQSAIGVWVRIKKTFKTSLTSSNMRVARIHVGWMDGRTMLGSFCGRKHHGSTNSVSFESFYQSSPAIISHHALTHHVCCSLCPTQCWSHDDHASLIVVDPCQSFFFFFFNFFFPTGGRSHGDGRSGACCTRNNGVFCLVVFLSNDPYSF